MRTSKFSNFPKNLSLAVLALGLLNCSQATEDKQGEQKGSVETFTPGGECPTPGSACFTAGYSADCFWEGNPYECECVPTGLYNAHVWLCEYQNDGPAGAGGVGGSTGGWGGNAGSTAGWGGEGGWGGGAGWGGSAGGDCGAAGSGPGGDSCQGFCGTQAPAGCFCDEVCEQAGDCCPDKFLFCGDDPGGNGGTGGIAGNGGSGGGNPFSCENTCGGATEFCGCYEGCELFGDCCPDKFDVCGGNPGGSGGAGGAGGSGGGSNSCENLCGGAADSCFCDEACEQFGDCCPDKIDFCGSNPGGSGGAGGSGPGGSAGGPGNNDSCLGLCGGFADVCACDEVCEQFGDCCADKIDLCGGSTAGAGGAGGGSAGVGGSFPYPRHPVSSPRRGR